MSHNAISAEIPLNIFALILLYFIFHLLSLIYTYQIIEKVEAEVEKTGLTNSFSFPPSLFYLQNLFIVSNHVFFHHDIAEAFAAADAVADVESGGARGGRGRGRGAASGTTRGRGASRGRGEKKQ
jgi:hypothetical protein